MKKILLIISVLLLWGPIYAQKSELGATVGASFYIGDLNPRKIFGMSHVAGGILYRYNFTPRWAIKANILFAKVEGSDAVTNKNYERNLSFISPITEISVQAELNFFKLYAEKGKNFFSPYIFVGIGLFSFNPQAKAKDGNLYALQHLGTEGQGLEGQDKMYSLCSFAIPFGIGLKFAFAKRICIGAEWGMRWTITDYLDDVGGKYYDHEALNDARGPIVAELADKSKHIHKAGSARGNSTTKDWYSYAGLTLTVKFGEMDRACGLRTNVKRKAIGGNSK